MLLDFEMAQHNGLFQAFSNEYGGTASQYHGRVVGCRVHLYRFLLLKGGNNHDDPFIESIMNLRDVDQVVQVSRFHGKLRDVWEQYYNKKV